jgi:hypothetical protein
MNRALLALAVAAAVSAASRAQDPSPPQPHSEAARAAERAQSMRDQIDTGRQVQSHVRVVVRLKNGNKLRGIVKDGRLVERVDGLRFVEALASDSGAGIRLWYSSGARNYVFVPFHEFAEYQVLQRLTPQQLEQFERDLQSAAERRPAVETPRPDAPSGEAPAPGGEIAPAADAGAQDPAKAAAPASPAAKAKTTRGRKGKAEAESGAAAKPAAVDTETQRVWFGLLQAYPPADGWSEAKCVEIGNRLNVIGAKPSAKEELFVQSFAEWQKAVAHFAVEAKPATGDQPATGSTSDGKQKRRK